MSPSDPVLGRMAELQLIHGFLAEATAHGATLLFSGEPGMGKSLLLDTAATWAAEDGAMVLRAAGDEFLPDVSYVGLGQALRPLHRELDSLTPVHRDALDIALGSADGPPADRMLVLTATLTLLRGSAVTRPVLLVIDDVQWLDSASAAALAFVARRLEGSHVGVLAAFRPDYDGVFEHSGLPEHRLRPLDDRTAGLLLGVRCPDLAGPVRARLLVEAGGNPLALVELPAALNQEQRHAREALPPMLPLGRRLRALFAAKIGALPPATRRSLLVAALEGTDDVGVLITARDERVPADLVPAEQARLVSQDAGSRRVTFRHPLVRSAVVELADGEERRSAHRALAGLTHQPERRAWHLADAATEPDERVAALLEDTARRNRQRGDAAGALAALLRAADLSPRGVDRGRRLAEAAYIGADVTGELRHATRLLVEARRADLDQRGSLQAAMAAAYLAFTSDGDLAVAHRILADAVEDHLRRSGDAGDALVEALHTLLDTHLYGGATQLSGAFTRALARLGRDVPLDLHLKVAVLCDPARASDHDIALLERAIIELPSSTDPRYIERIAAAAVFVDRVTGCREALWRVVADGREGGAVASALNCLILLCSDGFVRGRWDECDRLTHEGLELCRTHGYTLLTMPFTRIQALLAAARGQEATARALAATIDAWAAPRSLRNVRHQTRQILTLSALGRRDAEEAFHHAAGISPPGVLPVNTPLALLIALDLVEAAVDSGRHAEATAHVAAMREAGIARLSARLALVTRGAQALVAPAGDAAHLFDEALAGPDAERWPFDHARVQLRYGEHLRRQHRPDAARQHLGAAMDTFRRLGARPWEVRARQELRATGVAIGMVAPPSIPLTVPEMQVATLVASGLTNKEIGARLYLSHKTVAARLHRIFRKLGISSRAALHHALAELERSATPGDGTTW